MGGGCWRLELVVFPENSFVDSIVVIVTKVTFLGVRRNQSFSSF